MAVLGVGVDVVEIDRMQRTVERTPRILQRLFTTSELARCTSRCGDLRFGGLAARFCAKEALAKALGTGLRGFGWCDVEVANDEWGKPFIRLHGPAAALAQRRGIEAVHLSLSTSDSLAIANVVLEGGEPGRPAP